MCRSLLMRLKWECGFHAVHEPDWIDFRIMALLVNIVNLCSHKELFGGQSSMNEVDMLSKVHGEIVLLELLDIRTNRLITQEMLPHLVGIRTVAMCCLYLQNIGSADGGFGFLLSACFFATISKLIRV